MITKLVDLFFRNLDNISMAWIATILVVYGDTITQFVKKHTKQYHFPVRVMIFVLVSAFGYGVLTTVGTDVLSALIRKCNRELVIPVVVLMFVGIGILADRKDQI